MLTAPKLTIGSAVNNANLTATNSTTWTYSWNTSGVSAGSYTVTFTGQDIVGNSYSGNQSITINLDNTSPSVTITDNDADDILSSSSNVVITATFSEPMAGIPTITIGDGVTNANMTSTSSSVWTYTLDMSNWSGTVSSATVSITGIDLAGNSLTGKGIVTDNLVLNINADTPNVLSGATVNDASSQNNNFTNYGAALVTNNSGNYFDFSAGDFFRSVANAKLNGMSARFPITVTTRIKTTSSNNQYLLSLGRAGTFDGESIFRLNSGYASQWSYKGGMGYNQTNSAANRSTVQVNDGQWHEITWVNTGTNESSGIKIYIDGVLNKTVTGVTRSNTYNNVWSYIGKDGRDNNDFFVGQISKILVYNTGLTDAQVNQNYSGGDNLTFTIDLTGPKVTSITTSTTNGVYTDDDVNPSNSDTISFTVNFDEPVTITGSPRIPLSNITDANGNPVYATYVSGSGTASPTFVYTVKEGDLSNGVQIVSSGSIDLNGGSVEDLYGNTGDASFSTNSVSLSTGIELKATDPGLSVTLSSNNGGSSASAKEGDVITVTVVSDQPWALNASTISMTVTGLASQPNLNFTQTSTSPYTYTANFTLTASNTYSDGDINFAISASDTISSTKVTTANSVTANQSVLTSDFKLDNTAPTITSTSSLTITEGTTSAGPIEADETATFAITGGDDQANVTIDPQTGILTIDPAPSFGGNADDNEDGIYEVIVTATDSVGYTVTETIQIQVVEQNIEPSPEDIDGDGIPNGLDTDKDNDGVNDNFDSFPEDPNEQYDSDGDGIGNNADSDDDNDGFTDSDEALAGTDPLDPFSFPEDRDNDKLPDSLEPGLGTDPSNPDTDNDGVIDGEDDFPTDPNYTTDTDGDGLPNKTDPDDDNDGLKDEEDPFPLDPNNQTDTDGDGLNDGIDPDDDNDGFTDNQEIVAGTDPLDPDSVPEDTDKDGLTDSEEGLLGTDSKNPDTDGDGISDRDDAFPLDPNRGLDSDGDGIIDDRDSDDDNDGVKDKDDAFPLDPNETSDYDRDGIGDRADPDDDNDGYDDVVEIEDGTDPKDALDYPRDPDKDGLTTNQEIELGTDPANPDTDGDGISDSNDPEPLTPGGTTDTDRDGIIDSLDPDDDNDGYNDLLEIELGKDPKDPESTPEDRDKDYLPDAKEKEAGTDIDDPDTDGDGIIDGRDDFPLDPNASQDTDKDGIPDDKDEDDDNDGVEDDKDDFPKDPRESIDTDGDGVGDNGDRDDDGDGYSDYTETLAGSDPKDPDSKPVDTDNDLLSDVQENIIGTDPNDPDTDDDGLPDGSDPSPLDPDNKTSTDDFDGDGIPDDVDPDDDNDGVPDSRDRFPRDPDESRDSDGDGIGDNKDPDRDGDGVDNIEDLFPDNPRESSDSDGDGIGDNADLDDDNDGYPDKIEIVEGSDPLDPTSIPEDADKDGLSDAEEALRGTDPNNYDTDGDGVNDRIDAFPLDPDHNSDQDGDGIPDLLDPDDDNDGVPDRTDIFPYDPTESEDTDSDGIGNNADKDDDNDGYPDVIEIKAGTDPKDKEDFPEDVDGDGVSDLEEQIIGTDPNNPDTDGDGVNDLEDPFPLDPKFTKDTDQDGIPDLIDPDDDNDGAPDGEDAFPLDPKEQFDTDEDGIGDNKDKDDDNDGYSDVDELLQDTDPKDPESNPLDTDQDGVSDFLEKLTGTDPENPDTDGDGVIDGEDDFPLDPKYSSDNDGDGIPDEVDVYGDNDSDDLGDVPDIDDDNDGITDVAENVFITYYQNYKISIGGSAGKATPITFTKEEPKTGRNVGKWKVRKKVVGGADADKVKIVGGEPAAKGSQKYYSPYAKRKKNLGEGYLAFVNVPDPNNPDDANKDGVYEVEIAYVNTTAGDPNVPIPKSEQRIEINPKSEEIFELDTNITPVQEVSPDLISSDTDADGIINSRDPDDDGDHIYSEFEGSVIEGIKEIISSASINSLDTDGDGFEDFLDPDDDNDGVFSLYEGTDPNGDFNPNDAIDSDRDGTPDYLDTDDDGDGIASIDESPDLDQDGIPTDAMDFDGDRTPDYLDTDDENDGVPSKYEVLQTGRSARAVMLDTDRDGIADHHDLDDDNDGVPSIFEITEPGENFALDTDGDGILDHVDPDDDQDGLLTIEEDLNGNGDPRDDDTDFDGKANYLESLYLDADGDGVVDQLDSVNDDPYNDQDGDGFPNLDETLAGTDPLLASSFPEGFDNPSLRESIEIVNFFSPNGDGRNDTWQVREIDRYLNNQVWIYSRTGTELFTAKPYNNDWNGTLNGVELPAGSYYYRIDLDGNGSVDFEGWFYLTR